MLSSSCMLLKVETRDMNYCSQSSPNLIVLNPWQSRLHNTLMIFLNSIAANEKYPSLWIVFSALLFAKIGYLWRAQFNTTFSLMQLKRVVNFFLRSDHDFLLFLRFFLFLCISKAPLITCYWFGTVLICCYVMCLITCYWPFRV